MMNKQYTLKITGTLLLGVLLITSFLCLQSCRSTDTIDGSNGANSGNGNVRINLLTSEMNEETPDRLASLNNKVNATAVQKTIIPLDGATFIEATLTPEKPSLSTQAAITPGMNVNMPVNITYGIAIYDKATGAFVDGGNNYNTSNAPAEFKLTGDKTYTFVTYSLRNNSALPAPANVGPGKNITDASWNNINGDMMYDKRDFAVSGNVAKNNVSVVLQHKYSRISASVDARTIGNVIVQNAVITPAKQSANIKFSDNSFTYGADVSGGQSIVFSANDATQVNTGSNPVQVIAQATDNGVLTFGTIFVDKMPTTNFTMPVKIQPGLIYNMNMRLTPCRKDVNGGTFSVFPPNTGSTPTNNRNNIITANTGPNTIAYLIDFHRLDSSFTLTINGSQTTRGEIQFQTGEPSLAVNVEFEDGSRYGSNGLANIYSLTGTTDNPLIRVYITPDPANPGKGIMKLYGSKTSGGPLLPMRIFAGNTNNTIQSFTWNTGIGTNNTIDLSQFYQFGGSAYVGFFTAKQQANCP